MTINKLGYNVPSTFQMIKSINSQQPKMLKVHQDEFDRINKKDNQLAKPYKDYVQMLFITYIYNKKEIKPNVIVKHKHVGMKMLNKIALT